MTIVATSIVLLAAGLLVMTHGLSSSDKLFVPVAPNSPTRSLIASVPFYIVINGSTTYPSYTVSAGESVTLLIRIDSSLPVPGLSLSARSQDIPGKLALAGLAMQLPISQVNAPSSEIPLQITIGSGAVPGTYPMAVDAEENNAVNGGQIGFQAGFNLIVELPS